VTGLSALRRHLDPRPGEGRLLLVMLPGAGIAAEDFATRGLVAVAQAGETIVDVIAARPEQSRYLDGTVAPALQQAVLSPARRAGYRRIWILGISLGGMGALSCAAEYDGVEGLILLAPFIGTHGTMAELACAGGFAGWREEASIATHPERKILAWLQARLAGATGPALWLGHASRDRFAAGHRLLAAAMPEGRAMQVDGEHDWDAWRAAFEAIMARDPFRQEST
jgi:pimeloyl-ACP methyl ester carboxylesterase